MSETEDVTLYQKNQAVIVLSNDCDNYDLSSVSISTHLIGNIEHDKDDTGSSPEMMIDDTSLVSDDCQTEDWGKRLPFL